MFPKKANFLCTCMMHIPLSSRNSSWDYFARHFRGTDARFPCSARHRRGQRAANDTASAWIRLPLLIQSTQGPNLGVHAGTRTRSERLPGLPQSLSGSHDISWWLLVGDTFCVFPGRHAQCSLFPSVAYLLHCSKPIELDLALGHNGLYTTRPLT